MTCSCYWKCYSVVCDSCGKLKVAPGDNFFPPALPPSIALVMQYCGAVGILPLSRGALERGLGGWTLRIAVTCGFSSSGCPKPALGKPWLSLWVNCIKCALLIAALVLLECIYARWNTWVWRGVEGTGWRNDFYFVHAAWTRSLWISPVASKLIPR